MVGASGWLPPSPCGRGCRRSPRNVRILCNTLFCHMVPGLEDCLLPAVRKKQKPQKQKSKKTKGVKKLQSGRKKEKGLKVCKDGKTKLIRQSKKEKNVEKENKNIVSVIPKPTLDKEVRKTKQKKNISELVSK